MSLTLPTTYPLKLNLARTTTIAVTAPAGPMVGTSAETGAQTIVDQTQYAAPDFITKTIKSFAREMAALSCSIKKVETKRTLLRDNRANSVIPTELEYKFKNVLTKEHEVNLRSATIEASIDLEISQLDEKLLEMNRVFDSRMDTLKLKIDSTLTACNFTIDGPEMQQHLDYQISVIKFQFLTKMKTDEEKKEAKKAKFLERQEENQLEIIVTRKDANAVQKQIKALQKQVKQLSAKPKQTNSGKGKGATAKKNTAAPKPKQTGATKNSGGKGKSTAKGKKSLGKNGNK